MIQAKFRVYWCSNYPRRQQIGIVQGTVGGTRNGAWGRGISTERKGEKKMMRGEVGRDGDVLLLAVSVFNDCDVKSKLIG